MLLKLKSLSLKPLPSKISILNSSKSASFTQYPLNKEISLPCTSILVKLFLFNHSFSFEYMYTFIPLPIDIKIIMTISKEITTSSSKLLIQGIASVAFTICTLFVTCLCTHKLSTLWFYPNAY